MCILDVIVNTLTLTGKCMPYMVYMLCMYILNMNESLSVRERSSDITCANKGGMFMINECVTYICTIYEYV